MRKAKYRRPGSRKSQELVPSLRSLVDGYASDPLVVLESVRDDGRGVVLRTWDLHGPGMEQILATGLEYELSFGSARRPDGITGQSRVFTITKPEPITVDTATFGPVTLARSGAVLVDGGTDGRAGHRLEVDVSGTADWERRTGAFANGGCHGNGSLAIHGRDWSDYLRLSDSAWSYMRSPAPSRRGGDMPVWLWVVAMRVGDEVRVRESVEGMHQPPHEIANLLAWMARSVESWCVSSGDRVAEPRQPEPVAVALPVRAASPSTAHAGGGIGDAVARVRKDGWGPIIPPLRRGE